MKKKYSLLFLKRILAAVSVFFCGTFAFAENSSAGKEWIDTTVLFMLDAFAGNTGYYLMCALKIARLMLILMLLWDFIQMVVGTMEGRKVFIGSVTKYLFFLFILHVYPGFSMGLRRLAIEMGTGASGTSIAGLTKALGNYMDELEALLQAAKNDDIAQFSAKIQGAQSQFDQYKLEYDAARKAYDDGIAKGYSKYAGTATKELEVLELRMKNASTNIDNLKKEQRNMVLDNEYGASRTLLSLRQVLIKNEKDITNKYRLDMGLKTASGGDTGLISPNAMFRIGTLAAQIMWEKEWTAVESDIEKNKEEASFFFKHSTVANFPLKRIFDILLVLVAIVGLMFVMAVCLIQYIMALVEYTITSSFAIVLIPCMLFDPMKDMAQKVLPTLLAQTVKLIFITMAMFFCCWAFLQLATNISEQASGFDLNTFGYVIFTGLLTAAFCTFAPKWAQTLLTGQPQMSMGEFVAVTGAAVAGAMKTAHALNKIAHGLGKAGGKLGQKGTNALGTLSAMHGAGSAAKQSAAGEGRGRIGTEMAGLAGAAREGGSRFVGNLREKGENFLRGGAKGGGGGNVHPAKSAAADKTTEDTDNTRDFARHKTDGKKSGLREYFKAQEEAGRKNQTARIKRRRGESNVTLI